MSDFWTPQKAGLQLASGMVCVTGKALPTSVRLGRWPVTEGRESMEEVVR
ncbi:MAG: hypothetical protein LC808_03500 [Actinobacteria bacterium]|nr:hypothetical protein [Actinomycetota bacterium]